MIGSSKLPKRPVENWEQVRDEWVAAIERFMDEAEAWAKEKGWGVLREPKTIHDDDRLGSYTVSRLLIHDTFGRLLLDPIERFIVGAGGLIEFYVIPSYDWVSIVRTDRGWELHLGAADAPHQPWSKETFVDTARRLSERA
jgi:hypothetical protein